MSFLITLAWFLIAISILVAIHEFGHFYVARLCGVKVLRFSIGFGPRILSVKDRLGTEFALSAIPLGGYVKMLDEREGDVKPEEAHLSHNSKSIAQRIAIAAAGPAANMILAFILYWALLLNGVTALSPVIGYVEPESPAAFAGLESGQEIIAIDGQPTSTRRDVALALVERLGQTGDIIVTTQYSGDSLRYETPVGINGWMRGEVEPDPIKGLGLGFYYPEPSRVISSVQEDSAAELAGLQAGDRFLTVDNEEIESGRQWMKLIAASAEVPLQLTVERDGVAVALTLTPRSVTLEDGTTKGLAGVLIENPSFPKSMVRHQSYNVFEAFVEAGNKSVEAVAFIFISLRKLIIQEISIKNLSGPIGIAKVAADQASYGFWAFVSFLAQLSVMLAVFNILPIPVLDGGHILFYVVEWIKGSPLSESAQLMGVKAGMALLMSVMFVAFYNDILGL